jgi:phosphatidylethanolamine/phosphatidyl-N-methylethanolamine N-methyltransferase
VLDGERSPHLRSKGGLRHRWEDEARFIKTWLESPRTTGAVSPSGRMLSRAMARPVDPALPGPIVELGPGTGPVTEALIRRGVAPTRLVLVEFDPTFCKLLARRFPGVRVIQGDAYHLGRTLWQELDQPAAAVVSSLPLLNRPERERLSLLGEAFALMRPDAPFVQFTYGLLSPMPKLGFRSSPSFEAKVSAPIWLNLPPARVWVYRPGRDGAGEGRRKRDLIDKLKAGSEKIGSEWREQRRKIKAEWKARAARKVGRPDGAEDWQLEDDGNGRAPPGLLQRRRSHEGRRRDWC